MQRLVLLFLLLLLPVQWTWSAAASVCRHEASTQQSRHFGHHAHEHAQAESQRLASEPAHAAATPDQPADPAQPGDADSRDAQVHADCAACHVSAPALVMQAPALPEGPAARVATPYQRSITAGLPERLTRPPHQRRA